jgi:hypothetical protein
MVGVAFVKTPNQGWRAAMTRALKRILETQKCRQENRKNIYFTLHWSADFRNKKMETPMPL